MANKKAVPPPGSPLESWGGRLDVPIIYNNLWVPQDLPINFSGVVAACEYTSYSAEGGKVTSSLIREGKLCGKDFVCVPLARVNIQDHWSGEVVDLRPTEFEQVDYSSGITLRDAQVPAIEAMESSRGGTVVLACGKGKTVLALEYIARSRGPAVVVVDNLGLAFQWKASAMNFLGLSEHDIGVVYGQAKIADFGDVPSTVPGMEASMGRIVTRLSRISRKYITELNGRLLDQKLLKSREKGMSEDDVAEAMELLATLGRIVKAAKIGLPLWRRPLVIVAQRTLATHRGQLPNSVVSRFKTVFYDEAHHLPAQHLNKTADVFVGDRFSLTATPERDDNLSILMTSHTGGEIYRDTTPDIAAIHTVKEYVHVGNAPLPGYRRRFTSRGSEVNISALASLLAADFRRNTMLAGLVHRAVQAGRKPILLSLSKDLPSAVATILLEYGVVAAVVTGDTPAEHRSRLIRDSPAVLATLGVTKEGLDGPSLDTAIMATPFASTIAIVQSTGRIERRLPGKKRPIVVWVRDVGIKDAELIMTSAEKKLNNNGKHLTPFTVSMLDA